MDDAVVAKTLEELDGDRWGPAAYDSHLVREAHRLRAVRIGELTIENLRLLLGQQIGIEWLVPIALARLREDPLAEGDFYPGDLLSNVLGVDAAYWSSHPELLAALRGVRDSLEQLRNTSDQLLADDLWPSFE